MVYLGRVLTLELQTGKKSIWCERQFQMQIKAIIVITCITKNSLLLRYLVIAILCITCCKNILERLRLKIAIKIVTLGK